MPRLPFVKNPRRINLYLPGDLIDAAKAQAFEQRCSISAVTADALFAYIPKKVLTSLRANYKPTNKAKGAKRK